MIKFLKNKIKATKYTQVLRLLGFLYGFFQDKQKSYSQKGEDLLLKAYFDEIGVKNGCYLDIGCFHPVWISNTHIFHKIGWHGTAVDIDAFKLKAMRLVRGSKIKTIVGAVSHFESGFITIYKFDRIWSDIDTTDLETAKEYQKDGRGTFQAETVENIHINSILESGPHYNLINIDIEGADISLVNSIDFSRFLPDAILFEDNVNWGGSIETKKYLENYGYRLLFVSSGSICFALPPKHEN